MSSIKVGDKISVEGFDADTVQFVKGDYFWIKTCPHPHFNPYKISDLSEVEFWTESDGYSDAEETPSTEDRYCFDGLGKSEWVPCRTPSRDWQEHPSGALRESKEGKGLPHLILAGYPRALKALSKHMDCELGRERNWEKGLPESSLISSAFRHLLGYASGVSEDTAEYNLVALLWNVMCLVETYERVQDGVMDEELLDIRKEGA
jgi:hypothetical protein